MSLMAAYPHRYDILAMILLAMVLLLFGIFLPIMTIKEIKIIKDTFSVLTGIQALYQQKAYALAGIVVFFSIIFPSFKLISLLLLWTLKITAKGRDRVLQILEFVGKWSMLDVFCVAIFVVAAKLSVFASGEPRGGVYIFGASVFLSMISAMRVTKLAHTLDLQATPTHTDVV